MHNYADCYNYNINIIIIYHVKFNNLNIKVINDNYENVESIYNFTTTYNFIISQEQNSTHKHLQEKKKIIELFWDFHGCNFIIKLD